MKKIIQSIMRMWGAIISQWYMFLILGALYVWTRYFLPQQILEFFAMDTLQNQIAQKDLAIDFMKKLAGSTNLTAYLNYIMAVVDKTTLLGRLNMTELLSHTCQFLVLGFMNILLIILAVYTLIRIKRAYCFKTQQLDQAALVVQELRPYLNELHQEVAHLRLELQQLKKNGTQ